MDVNEGEGLYFWLLQYEKNIKVIAPVHVKIKLIEKIKGILEMYDKEDVLQDEK